MNKIFKEGNIVTTYSEPGAGMTNVAVFVTWKALQKGYTIHTNVRWKK